METLDPLVLSFIAIALFVPKGIIVYEALGWLPWYLKMRSYPLTPHHEHKYIYGKHKRQYFLFLLPGEEQAMRDAVIVYIHGGGWQFGSPEMFRPNALSLVEMGYPVFMISHRRIPEFDILDMREDLVMCMLEIRKTMKSEGLSDKKIILGGVSSGGNLASLLAFDSRLREAVGWREELPAGVFLIAAPLNLGGMWQSPPLWFLAGKRDGDRFRLANPIDQLAKGENLRTLIIHGTHDGLVKYQSVVDFYKKMKVMGASDVQFETIKQGTHLDAASWCFPDHISNQILLNWLNERL